MANLNLYTGIAPNSNGLYIYYSQFANYLSNLSTHLLTSVSEDKYLINTGAIRINIDTTLTLSNYKQVVYIINDVDNVCYFVRNSLIQSGYVIYYVFVDFWGSYIAQATFDLINVVRCNRRIGTGIYDDIRATNSISTARFPVPAGEYVTGKPDDYIASNVYIVFNLVYNVEQTPFGATSATGMYALSLDTIYNKYIALGGGTAVTTFVDIAVGVVGGIYGIASTNGYGVATTNDARVTKAYIINKDLIHVPALPDGVVSVASKSMFGTFGVGNTIDVLTIYHGVKTKTLTLDNDPDYNFFIGTMNKGLKVVRNTNTTLSVDYRCITSNDGLTVSVVQGDNQIDITSEFEVVLTTNDGDVTNLSGIKTALAMFLKTGQAVATKGVAGVATLAPDIIGLYGHHFSGGQIGNGDGVVTFWKSGSPATSGVHYPYGYAKCRSIINEQDNAKYKGAFFDTYVSTFASIFTYALLYGTNIPTYIQANVSLSNVPTEAQDAIREALGRGIYVISV